MGRFDRGGFGGRPSFGPKRDFHNRGSAKPTMYKAVCSKCGKDCEVPFRPNGDKPVFCRDCFRENGGGSRDRAQERNFSKPQFDSRNADNAQLKEQIAALNSKLDTILRLLAAVSPQEIPKVRQPEEKVAVEKKKRTKRPSKV